MAALSRLLWILSPSRKKGSVIPALGAIAAKAKRGQAILPLDPRTLWGLELQTCHFLYGSPISLNALWEAK